MHQLNKRQIISWRNQKHSRETVFMPHAINQSCPHCRTLVTFSFRSWHRSPQMTAQTKSACPNCAESVSFFLLEHAGSEECLHAGASLWIHPKPDQHISLLAEDFSKTTPEPILRTYEATVNVYNAREWTASTVLMEQLWQSILEYLMPGQTDFSKLGRIKKVKHLRDLFGAFVKLVASLKTEAQLVRFFELNDEPDEQTATLILECLEYMLEYLFISPEKLNNLFDQLRAMPNQQSSLNANSSEKAIDALPPDLVDRTN